MVVRFWALQGIGIGGRDDGGCLENAHRNIACFSSDRPFSVDRTKFRGEFRATLTHTCCAGRPVTVMKTPSWSRQSRDLTSPFGQNCNFQWLFFFRFYFVSLFVLLVFWTLKMSKGPRTNGVANVVMHCVRSKHVKWKSFFFLLNTNGNVHFYHIAFSCLTNEVSPPS